MTKNQSENDRWNNYYDIVEGRPPRETLLFALTKFEKEGPTNTRLAIDLGCGVGNNSVELMKRGWSVLAVDKQPIALERLSERIEREKAIKKTQLQTMVSSFEDLQLPNSYLLNASYALPFCQPDQFQFLWQTITDSIQAEGRFLGHVFGKNDQWAEIESMFFIDRADIENLFSASILNLLKRRMKWIK